MVYIYIYIYIYEKNYSDELLKTDYLTVDSE